MIYLVIALFSFAFMGILHKMGDRWHGTPILVAMFTMISSCLFSTVLAFFSAGATVVAIPGELVLNAIPFGICANMGLWFFQAGLRYGHIATSWLIINLSSAIPASLSIVVYGEPLTPRRSAIFGLIVISMLLLWWDRRRQSEASL